MRRIALLALLTLAPLAFSHAAAPNPSPQLGAPEATPMTLPLVIASLIERITLVEPDYDRESTFYTLEGADLGPALELDQVTDEVVRLFELRAGVPTDDGGSGYAFDRWRVRLTLRVRYHDADRARVDAMVGSDVPRLVHALTQPHYQAPGANDAHIWHANIDSVIPPNLGTATPLPAGGVLLTMPVDVIYRDSGAA